MKPTPSSFAALVPVIGLLLLAGCTTVQPLTHEDKARLHSIYVSSNLGTELQFEQIGLTVFSKNVDTFPDDAGVLSGVSAGVQKALESRGYALATEAAQADGVLVLERGNAPVTLEVVDVRGAGFYTRSVLGVDPGILVTARINFQLKDPKTGKVLATATVPRMQPTAVKHGLAKWVELTEEERQALITALKAQLLTVPDDGVKELGL
jgi:hypothetical protein